MNARPDNELENALAASGMTLTTDEATRRGNAIPFRPRALYGRPLSERAMNMHARLERILQGVARKSTIEGAVAGAEHAALAKEFVLLWGAFTLRREYGDPLGPRAGWPFDNLAPMEAGAKLNRLLEDLCDRSTGRMGPWTNGISETARAAR